MRNQAGTNRQPRHRKQGHMTRQDAQTDRTDMHTREDRKDTEIRRKHKSARYISRQAGNKSQNYSQSITLNKTSLTVRKGFMQTGGHKGRQDIKDITDHGHRNK